MVTKKNMAVVAAGSGAGLAQVFVLREYVDKTQGSIPGLESLGGFGTYSALGGIISGGLATGVGLVSVLTGKITRNETLQLGLIGYGIPALSGGVLSGLFPAITIPPAGGLRVPARARAPSITLGPSVVQRAAATQGASGVIPSRTSAIPLRR